MALVRLQDVDWTLTDKRQDIRGRELRDAVGRSLGEIEQMIVDTDQERVVSVRLQDATEFPADDLQIMEDAVYYIPPDVPVATADPVAAVGAPAPAEGADAESVVGGATAPVALASSTDEIPAEFATEPAVAPPMIRVPEADPEVPAPPSAVPPIPTTHRDHGVADPSMTPPEITVPETDVAIPAPPEPEPMPAPAAEPQAPGAYLDADFRDHFGTAYSDSRLTYGALQFAYRFGFDAARTPPLDDRKLPGVEESLRRVFYARFNYPASDELVWGVAGDAVREGFRLGKR